MLTWRDANEGVEGGIPGVQFVDATQRWRAVRVGEDPRLGWAVWEHRAGRFFRRVQTISIGSAEEAQAVAQVLADGLARHVVRLAEAATTAAAVLVVASARRLLAMGRPAAPVVDPPRKPTHRKRAREFKDGEVGVFGGDLMARDGDAVCASDPPKYTFKRPDGTRTYLLGDAKLEVAERGSDEALRQMAAWIAAAKDAAPEEFKEAADVDP